MIGYFKSRYGFLSNFYPVDIMYEGMTFASVEHAFQAAKTQVKFRRVPFTNRGLLPMHARRMGRALPLRYDWESVKLDIMSQLVRQKFDGQPGTVPGEKELLQQLLLNTGQEDLVEGNHHGDTFWGSVNGEGSNWLGIILMVVRAEIRGMFHEWGQR